MPTLNPEPSADSVESLTGERSFETALVAAHVKKTPDAPQEAPAAGTAEDIEPLDPERVMFDDAMHDGTRAPEDGVVLPVVGKRLPVDSDPTDGNTLATHAPRVRTKGDADVRDTLALDPDNNPTQPELVTIGKSVSGETGADEPAAMRPAVAKPTLRADAERTSVLTGAAAGMAEAAASAAPSGTSVTQRSSGTETPPQPSATPLKTSPHAANPRMIQDPAETVQPQPEQLARVRMPTTPTQPGNGVTPEVDVDPAQAAANTLAKQVTQKPGTLSLSSNVQTATPGQAPSAAPTSAQMTNAQADGLERTLNQVKAPIETAVARLAGTNAGEPEPTPASMDVRRSHVLPEQRPAMLLNDAQPAQLRDSQELAARKPLPTSAAALYGRVQLDAVRRQTTNSEVTIAEPKVHTESVVPERVVAPALRVEQTSLPEAVRMQQAMFTPETREQLSQSVQEQVMRVITRQAVLQGKLQLQLNPRELGQLDIEFSAERGGEVQVAIVARESATRDLLESALPRLRQNLLDAGVHLADVDLRNGEQQERSQRFDARPQPTPLAESDEVAAPAIIAREPEGLLSFYV